jgi:hypothetical protein
MLIDLVVEVEVDEKRITKRDKETLIERFKADLPVISPDLTEERQASILKAQALLLKGKIRGAKVNRMVWNRSAIPNA